jgi:hypothetical protein
MEETGHAYRTFVGKPEEMRHFVRSRHSWEDNIKMDLQGLGWEGVH